MGLESSNPYLCNRDDAVLLNILQDGIPLVVQPWGNIALRLGWTPQQVISRVERLYTAGVIRCISGIFDPAALGYTTALVAFDVHGVKNVQKTLDDSAAAVSAHPGVSHCYSRDDDMFDLWFTLAVSSQSTLGLKSTVERLAKNANVKRHMILPAMRKFKLRVRFDFDAANSPDESLVEIPEEESQKSTVEVTPQQRCAIRALQVDLPRTAEPFSELAAKAKMDVDEMLTCAAELLATGKMRRYAAAINHRTAGATANVMVVWNVFNTDNEAESAGTKAASFPAVTHCYLRPPADNWKYSLYTMIQTQSIPESQQVIQRIASKIGSPPRRELWTTAEYKKSRVKLFTNDEAVWEAL